MKSLLIIIFLSFNLFSVEKSPTSDEPRIFLEDIRKYAIRIGTGDSKIVYMFVDPMCKFSKRIMSKISENKMIQLANSYYVFLYRLPKLDSEKLIHYIYQSDDPKTVLLEVMVDEEIVELDGFKASSKTLKEIKTISDVAKRLDMKLRPYMISFEKDSKFCRVSEGTASCLDEFE